MADDMPPYLSDSEVDRLFREIVGMASGGSRMTSLIELTISQREDRLKQMEQVILRLLQASGGTMKAGDLLIEVATEVECSIGDVTAAVSRLEESRKIDPSNGSQVILISPPGATMEE